MSKVTYEVRMKFYQYNTGMGNNGYRNRTKSFNTEAEAWDFYADVKLMKLNKRFPHRWAEEYVDDGYLEELVGVYKVTVDTEELYKEPDGYGSDYGNYEEDGE